MSLMRRFIVGPTASGKARLAVRMAQRWPLELLSMDSMKVYRGMDLGTAKLNARLRAAVTTHLVDLRDPWEPFAVADYVSEAKALEVASAERGSLPLYVGGTALYAKALTEGMFAGPAADHAFREQLRALAAAEGADALFARLKAVDPAAAGRLHPNDLRRVIRALEVFHKTGQPISELQTQWQRAPRVDRRMVGVRWPRELLRLRIEERVVTMMELGLVQEVRVLMAAAEGIAPTAAQAIGYREVMSWIAEGESEPLPTVVERIQRNTWRFARRQMTFFKHFPDIHWLDVDEDSDWEALALEAEAHLELSEVTKG